MAIRKVMGSIFGVGLLVKAAPTMKDIASKKCPPTVICGAGDQVMLLTCVYVKDKVPNKDRAPCPPVSSDKLLLRGNEDVDDAEKHIWI